jgi:hypothetical protein
MMRLGTTFAAGVLLALGAMSAQGQRVRLDDSLSPIQAFAVELAWSPSEVTRALQAMLLDAPEATPRATGRIPNVEVRLDTSEFVGRAARIYLSLPIPSSGLGGTLDLELRWEASGSFLPGAVRPGQSTLVFEGVLEEPVTSVVFNFSLALENGAAADPFDLEPVYEIELLP